jgi:hypothetical protein
MRTNEKTTTLQEYNDIHVKADYFCVTDDKLVNWNDQVNLPAGWIHAKVKIDLLEFTETFEERDKAMDVKVQRLYINDDFIGELIGVGVVQGETGLIMKCAVCVEYN